jgi:voltage-gated potassium channel Kch
VVLFLVAPFPLFIILGLPIGGLAILMAFYPVNNRPFSVYLESMIRYMGGTKLYLWRKEHKQVYTDARETVESTDEASATIAQNMHVPTVTKSHLTDLSRNLELNAIEKQ